MIFQTKEVKAPSFLIQFGSKKQPFGDQVETALQELWKELTPKPETEIKSKEDDTAEAPGLAHDGLAKSIALCFLQWPQKVPLHAGLMVAYISTLLPETEVVDDQTRIGLLKKIFDHLIIEVTFDLKNGKLNRALCFFRFAACLKTMPVLSSWVKPLETLYLKSLVYDSVGILNKDIICYLMINYLLDSLTSIDDLTQHNIHLVDAIKKHMADRKQIEIQNPESVLTELSEHRKKCYSPFKTSNLELFIDPLQAVFQSLMDITQDQGIEDSHSQFSSQYIVRSYFNKSFIAKYPWNTFEENSQKILNILPDLQHSVDVNFSLADYNQNMHPILEFYFTECRMAYPKLLGYPLDKDVKEVSMPRFHFMQLRQLLRSIVQEYETDIERCYQVLLQVTCLHRHYLIVLLEFLMAEMLISKRPLLYHRLMQCCSREQESLKAMIPTIVYIYLRKIPDLNLFGLERMADFVSYWYAVDNKNFDIKWWTSRFEQGAEKPLENVVKAEIEDDDMETVTEVKAGEASLSLVKTNDEEIDVVFEETSLLDLYPSKVENLLIRIFKKYIRLRHIQDLKKLLPASFLRFVKEEKENEFFDESETPFEFKALLNFLCYDVERKKEDNTQSYSRQDDEFHQQSILEHQASCLEFLTFLVGKKKWLEAADLSGISGYSNLPPIKKAESAMEDDPNKTEEAPFWSQVPIDENSSEWTSEDVRSVFFKAIVEKGRPTSRHFTKLLENYKKIFPFLLPETSMLDEDPKPTRDTFMSRLNEPGDNIDARDIWGQGQEAVKFFTDFMHLVVYKHMHNEPKCLSMVAVCLNLNICFPKILLQHVKDVVPDSSHNLGLASAISYQSISHQILLMRRPLAALVKSDEEEGAEDTHMHAEISAEVKMLLSEIQNANVVDPELEQICEVLTRRCAEYLL